MRYDSSLPGYSSCARTVSFASQRTDRNVREVEWRRFGMRQYVVVDGKRFVRTYAEHVPFHEISDYIKRLREDDWTEFHLEEVSDSRFFNTLDKPPGDKANMRFDIYAWRDLK